MGKRSAVTTAASTSHPDHTNAATQPQTTQMFPVLALASAGAFMGPRCVPAQAPRCVTPQAPRTMGPVAGIQLTPDEQRDIQQEISNLNMRLLSVEKSTEILAVNTNRTNAIVKDLKRNYYDVSRSPLLSPTNTSSLNSPIDWASVDIRLGFDTMEENRKKRNLANIVVGLLVLWIWSHHWPYISLDLG